MTRRPHLEPGDVVSVRFAGVLRHYGIVTSAGTVMSNSRRHGGVIEQTLADFTDGKRLRRHSAMSDRHHLEVEARARRVKGARYDLAGSNCGHFVRWTHRRSPTPMQVGAATLMALRDMLRTRR